MTEEDKKVPTLIKIFLAGQGGVGKTTMVNRFVEGAFLENMIMTIGVSHSIKTVTTLAGTECQLQIWDLGGEERFKNILPIYIRGASGGLVCFDLTRYSTYKALLADWTELIREGLPDVPLILVGLKYDLVEDKFTVEALKEKYSGIVDQYNFDSEIFITSSKSGEKVEDAFVKLASLVIDK